MLILGYSIYAFFTPQVPRIQSPFWGYGLGFISGVCGGAYNSSGPASVVYAHSQRWEPNTFKGNLQAYFIFNSALINISHLVSGNFNKAVLHGFLLAIPGMIIGMTIGFHLSRRLNANRFRQIVLLLLFALGIRLIITHIS